MTTYILIGFSVILMLTIISFFSGDTEIKKATGKRARILNNYKKKYPDLSSSEILEVIDEVGISNLSDNAGFDKQEYAIERKKKAVLKYKNLKPENGSIDDPYYIYFYEIEGVIKYVGKGTTYLSPNVDSIRGVVRYERAADIYGHKYCRPYRSKINIRVIETFNNESEALKRESELIAGYGVKNLLNKKA